MRVNVNLAVEEGDRSRLAEVEIVHLGVEQAWVRAANLAVRQADLPSRLQRRGLGRVRIRRAELRESGVLLGTRTALLTLWVRQVVEEIRHELVQAGESVEWPEVPDGVSSLPGRRVGVSPRPGDGLPDRVNISLDADLVETVRRAAFWMSEPAERALQEWADRHGPGPAAGGLALLAAALRGFPSAEEMQARSDARNKIITTGMLFRQAVWRAIAANPLTADPDLEKLQDKAATEGRTVGTKIGLELSREHRLGGEATLEPKG